MVPQSTAVRAASAALAARQPWRGPRLRLACVALLAARVADDGAIHYAGGITYHPAGGCTCQEAGHIECIHQIGAEILALARRAAPDLPTVLPAAPQATVFGRLRRVAAAEAATW